MHTKQRRSARRRATAIFCVAGVVMAAFTVRLVDIQVVNAQENLDNRVANSSFTASQTLFGTRGTIVDANGTVLASSSTRYTVGIDPQNIPGVVASSDTPSDWADAAVATARSVNIRLWQYDSDRIAAVLGVEGQEVRDAVAQAVAVNSATQYVQIARNINTEKYRQLVALGLGYLGYDPSTSRAYPNGAVAGNLLGFITADGDYKSGIEATQDACLQSSDGEATYERAPGGLIIPGTETTEEPVDGGTVQLTIDADLQWYLQQMMAEEVQNQGAQSGSALVVEAKTGAVKAAVDYPTLDPNDPIATDPADRGSRIFTTTFEPGSTFKAVTAATLIDQGLATPESSVSASSFEAFPNGARVGDAFQHPAYNYTLTGALIDSSNVALSKFGDLASDEVRAEYLQRFGIGTATSIGAQGEESGYMIPVTDWDAQTHYATTFGQAFTATMPQVVSAYQVLANNGVKKALHMVESCTSSDGEVFTPDLPADQQVVSENTADTVIEMLENVAAQGDLADIVQVPGYRIATKTGTAQKSDGNGGYKSGLYYTSIMGVVPADDPEYVVMITMDEPTRVTSSAATAPALQKAITQLMKISRVAPADSEAELLPKFAE